MTRQRCAGRRKQRKHMDEAPGASEARYRDLFLNAHDIVYSHDLNGILTSVNQAAERVTGYRPDQMIGKNFLEFIAPEYRQRARRRRIADFVADAPIVYELAGRCEGWAPGRAQGQ